MGPAVQPGSGGHRNDGGPDGRRGPRVWTAEQLSGDPVVLLTPLAERVSQLAAQQRYEEAGAVRDEAERLRVLLDRHRRETSLREAGRVVLAVDGEGGWFSTGASGSEASRGPAASPGDVADEPDGADHERSIVAQWLAGNTGSGPDPGGRVAPRDGHAGPPDPGSWPSCAVAGSGHAAAAVDSAA